jgi:hypothetical protein
MSYALSFSSLVAMRDGCSISYEVGGSGQAWFQVGTADDGLEFDMDCEALREFVRLGSEALTEMDARYAKEQAEAPASQGKMITGAGRDHR